MPKLRSKSGEDEKFRRERCSEGSRNEAGGIECSYRVRVVHRLLAIVRKCRRGKRAAVLEERDCTPRRSEKDDAGVEAVNVRHDSPENCRGNDVSECRRREMTYNLALGGGLLSLIAASKTELDKMIELRKQMEALLISITEEHQSNITPTQRSDIDIAYDVSTSPYSIEGNATSFSQPESGITFVCDKDGDMYEKESFLERMDHLEEELAAELELLQLHIDTDDSSQNHDATETFSIDTKSASDSSGEVIDAQDEEDERRYYGVPPLELERRLHELQQERQEERIKELEAHLECLKKKLHEKEVEVTWWKDTAKLISKQVSQSSRVSRLRKVICDLP